MGEDKVEYTYLAHPQSLPIRLPADATACDCIPQMYSVDDYKLPMSMNYSM